MPRRRASRPSRHFARPSSAGAASCRSTTCTNGRKRKQANSLMRSRLPTSASWRSRAYRRTGSRRPANGIRTFAVISTQPNELCAELHNRHLARLAEGQLLPQQRLQRRDRLAFLGGGEPRGGAGRLADQPAFQDLLGRPGAESGGSTRCRPSATPRYRSPSPPPSRRVLAEGGAVVREAAQYCEAPVPAAEGPVVRRLPAGGRRIRTLGPAVGKAAVPKGVA